MFPNDKDGRSPNAHSAPTEVINGELHGAYIQHVDTSKPLGKLVENYANQKWWKGFYIGWSSGLIVAAVSFICSSKLKKGL